MDGSAGCDQRALGEFLVCIGAMSEDQLLEVMRRKRNEPDKLFGEIAIECGYIDDEVLQSYIDLKYAGIL